MGFHKQNYPTKILVQQRKKERNTLTQTGFYKQNEPTKQNKQSTCRVAVVLVVFSLRNFNFCFFQYSAMQVVIFFFLSSYYNSGWRTSVKSCLFEILLLLDSVRAHNFSKTHVAYAGIKANTRIQLFEVEQQSPKVGQFQFQLH